MAITLTKSDFVNLGLLSPNCNTQKLDIAIQEAIRFDMEKLWNKTFIYLESNWTSVDAKWTDLVGEKEFTGCNDLQMKHIGAKTILCYYAYARYVVINGFDDTPTGTVQKVNDFTVPKSFQELNAFANKYKAMGKEAFKNLQSFISINNADYPEFERIYGLSCGCVENVCENAGKEKYGATRTIKSTSGNISKYD